MRHRAGRRLGSLLVIVSLISFLPASVPIVRADDPKSGGAAGAESVVGASMGDRNPLRVTITPDLNCAAEFRNDTYGEFYGDTACATLVVIDGTLYGPNDIPAGINPGARTAVTPISQLSSGTGTAQDPWLVTTTVAAGATGIRLVEKDSYVQGEPTYRTSVSIVNTSPSQIEAVLYRALDCYVANSDFGFGYVKSELDAPGCRAADSGPEARLVELRPDQPADYMEGFYGDIWDRIETHQPFPRTQQNNSSTVDNGLGVSWGPFIVPSGLYVGHRSQTVFGGNDCSDENLSETTAPSGAVVVRYDPAFISPLQQSNAAAIAAAIRSRAESTLWAYHLLDADLSVPAHVEIVVTCDPKFLDSFSTGGQSFTENQGLVRVHAAEIRSDFERLKPNPSGAYPIVAGSAWTNIIDHELFHTVEYATIGTAVGHLVVWSEYKLLHDYTNYESAAVLAQDLLSDMDDDSQAKFQSYLNITRSFFGNPVDVDSDGYDGFTPYQLAAFYQYLAERFGDRSTNNLETRVAQFEKALFSRWLPIRLDRLRSALGLPRTRTFDPLLDAMRDFYVAGYLHDAPNVAQLSTKFRILDEVTAHGAATTSTGLPSYAAPNARPLHPLDVEFDLQRTLDVAKGTGGIFEIDLAAHAIDAASVQFSIPTSTPGASAAAAQSRVAFVPLTATGAAINRDPNFGANRGLWSGLGLQPYIVSTAGASKLAVIVVSPEADLSLNLRVSAAPTAATLTTDAIPDVLENDLAYLGLAVVAHPRDADGIMLAGLPSTVWSASIEGVPATITSSAQAGDHYNLSIRPGASVSPGLRTLTLNYGAATATTTFTVLSGNQNPPRYRTALSISAGGAGDPIEGQLYLTGQDGAGLPGAAASMTVTDPNGAVRHFEMVDDGGPADGGSEDGAYGQVAFGTSIPGSYSVHVVADGTDSDGTPFQYVDDATVVVGSANDADGDTVSDETELFLGLDPADSSDGTLDLAGDGMTVASKLAHGLDARSQDADGGGESDASELAAGGDPLVSSDDTVLPDVAVGAFPLDENIIRVAIAASDTTTPIHIYRVGGGQRVDIGTVVGLSATIDDGPLASGVYTYEAAAVTGAATSASTETGPVTARADATSPAFDLQVNADNRFARNTMVEVAFTDVTADVADMRLAGSEAELAAAEWQPYSALATFTVSATQGDHPIYAQIRDAAGNASAVMSAVVTIDTEAPASEIDSLPATTSAPSLDLTVAASDGSSEVEAVDLWTRYRRSAGDSWSVWSLAASQADGPIAFNFAQGGGFYEFYTTAVDSAGNREEAPAEADATIEYIVPGDTTPPTAPADVTATANAYNTVTVSWTASTDANGIAKYTIARDGAPIAVVRGATTFVDWSVHQATQYAYAVTAVDPTGNPSAPSTSATTTTPSYRPADTIAPTAPTGLSATAIGTNRVDLTWSLSTDAVGVQGYKLYRNGAFLSALGPIGTTSFSDTGLSPNTAYTYTVSAIDGAGNESAQSGAASATTAPLDTTAPTVPTGVGATASAWNSVAVSWTASSDSSGVVRYAVFRGGTLLATVNGSTTTFTDHSTSPTTAYGYTVKASDPYGNTSAASAAANVTTPSGSPPTDSSAPTTPTSPSATASGSARINLTWAGSSDGSGVGVQAYKLYRNGTYLSAIGPIGSTSFSDTGLASGTMYTYKVSALDGKGNESAQSTQVSATTAVVDNTAPTVPTAVAATGNGGDVTVTWTASTDAVGVTKYTVLRGGTAIGIIAPVTGSTQTYHDRTAAMGTAYSYTIQASDAAGNTSAASSAGSVTTPATVRVRPTSDVSNQNFAPNSGTNLWSRLSETSSDGDTTYISCPAFPLAVCTAQVALGGASGGAVTAATIHWTAKFSGSASGQIRLILFDGANPVGTSQYRTLTSSYSSFTETFGNLSVSSLANLRVQIEATGSGASGSSLRVTYVDVDATTSLPPDSTAPTVPTGLTATVVGDNQINLSWTASSDANGVQGYKVFHDTIQVGTLSVGGTVFKDTGLTQATSYTYKLSAIDGAGNESAKTSGVTATTTGDTAAPSVPTGVSATALAWNDVLVVWSASTDNVGVTRYQILRGGTPLAVVNWSTVTFHDHSTDPSTTYSYTIKASDAVGNTSAASTAANATTPAYTPPADTTAPSTPSNLTATAAGTTRVDLAWTASTDANGVQGYKLYRGGTYLSTVGPVGTTSFSDTGLTPGTAYTYTVSAIDGSGNESAQSSAASATTVALDTIAPSAPASPAATVTAWNHIDLTWTASTDAVGVVRYTIFRDGTLLATVNGASAAFVDRSTHENSTYDYSVSATDAAGNTSAVSTTVAAATPLVDPPIDSADPTTPTGLGGSVDGLGHVLIQWTAATDDTGIQGYVVRRDGTPIELVPVGSTSYLDTTSTFGSSYAYTVEAVDGAGNASSESSPLSVFT